MRSLMRLPESTATTQRIDFGFDFIDSEDSGMNPLTDEPQQNSGLR